MRSLSAHTSRHPSNKVSFKKKALKQAVCFTSCLARRGICSSDSKTVGVVGSGGSQVSLAPPRRSGVWDPGVGTAPEETTEAKRQAGEAEGDPPSTLLHYRPNPRVSRTSCPASPSLLTSPSLASSPTLQKTRPRKNLRAHPAQKKSRDSEMLSA